MLMFYVYDCTQILHYFFKFGVFFFPSPKMRAEMIRPSSNPVSLPETFLCTQSCLLWAPSSGHPPSAPWQVLTCFLHWILPVGDWMVSLPRSCAAWEWREFLLHSCVLHNAQQKVQLKIVGAPQTPEQIYSQNCQTTDHQTMTMMLF